MLPRWRRVYRQLGDKPADVRDVAQLKGFYDAIQALVAQRKLRINTTTVPTAALVTQWQRWPSPAALWRGSEHCDAGRNRLAALFKRKSWAP